MGLSRREAIKDGIILAGGMGLGATGTLLKLRYDAPIFKESIPPATDQMTTFAKNAAALFGVTCLLDGQYIGQYNKLTQKFPFTGEVVILNAGGNPTKMAEIVNYFRTAHENTGNMVYAIGKAAEEEAQRNQPKTATTPVVKETPSLDTNVIYPELLRRIVQKDQIWSTDRPVDLKNDPKNQVAVAIMGAIDAQAEFQLYYLTQDTLLQGKVVATRAKDLNTQTVIRQSFIKVDTTSPMGTKLSTIPEVGK